MRWIVKLSKLFKLPWIMVNQPYIAGGSSSKKNTNKWFCLSKLHILYQVSTPQRQDRIG